MWQDVLIMVHGRILGTNETRNVLWKKYKTKEELMLAIEKYIDYYTNKRIQRNLGVLTPMEFHKQKLENVA